MDGMKLRILLFRICVHLRDLPAPLAHFIVPFHSAIPDSAAAGRAARNVKAAKHCFCDHFQASWIKGRRKGHYPRWTAPRCASP